MTTKFMVLKSGHNVIYNNALKYFNFFLFGVNLYTPINNQKPNNSHTKILTFNYTLNRHLNIYHCGYVAHM